MERGDDGVRRVTRVVEVQGMESGVVVTAELFAPAGDSPQTLQATGVRPRVAERIEARGIALPSELFAPGPALVGQVGDRRWRR
jgi:pilus assembly protein CpaF